MYDIRSKQPLLVKNTHNDLPVTRIHYLPHAQEAPLVATLDAKAVKLWNESDGRTHATIEPEAVALNDMHFVQKSGQFAAHRRLIVNQ